MPVTSTLRTKNTVSMTDLRRNPSAVLHSAGNHAVQVLSHNRPAAYFLSARAYEALLEKVDDAALTKLVKQRKNGPSVKISLDDL